jgi:hypothetical protein
MAKYGVANLPGLIAALADCPKTQSFSFYDRCKARYEGLATR